MEKTPTPDFDGNKQVDFADFLAFVARFGASRGDSNYDAKYDLDGDGTIGFEDFLIFTTRLWHFGVKIKLIRVFEGRGHI